MVAGVVYVASSKIIVTKLNIIFSFGNINMNEHRR